VGPIVAEYLRVDEIAERFHVSIEDVLAACSVLGFPVHDRDGLIELDLFTQALKAAAPTHAPEPTERRRPRVAVLSAAAAVVVLIGAFAFTRGPSVSHAPTRAAASYRAQLKHTYEATVGDAPVAPDYRTLAHDLAAITPPPELRAEHAQLVAEAQTVADLTEDAANSVSGTTATAVDQLREHVEQVETTRVGK
jgi:hypothetical protein